jgi:3-isopropylmalate/(R)-2-methylmalate dehydratase small subunit
LHNRTSGASREFKPVSPIILDILEAGGSRDWALRRINASSAGVQG